MGVEIKKGYPQGGRLKGRGRTEMKMERRGQVVVLDKPKSGPITFSSPEGGQSSGAGKKLMTVQPTTYESTVHDGSHRGDSSLQHQGPTTYSASGMELAKPPSKAKAKKDDEVEDKAVKAPAATKTKRVATKKTTTRKKA